MVPVEMLFTPLVGAIVALKAPLPDHDQVTCAGVYMSNAALMPGFEPLYVNVVAGGKDAGRLAAGALAPALASALGDASMLASALGDASMLASALAAAVGVGAGGVGVALLEQA